MFARAVTRAALELTRPERMRWFRMLSASQWWPREKLEEYKNARLQALLRHALGTVPYYREFAAQAGLDARTVSAADLPRFPLVDKPVMTARLADFRSDAVPAGRFHPNSTSGSTGTPFRFFTDTGSGQVRLANDLRVRMWTGWRIGERQALLWGHRGDVAKRGDWFHRFRNEFSDRVLTLNAYDLGEPQMAHYQRLLMKHRPTLMVGYSSALTLLAQYVRRNSLPFPQLKGCISTAETLLPEQRQAIEAGFACPVLDHYGSREFGTISQQCRPGSAEHITVERVCVEVLDTAGRPAGPGEQGEIVVTDLDNYAMPFIRYRTADLGTLGAGPCDCGRGLPLLESVAGRVSEIIVGRNGKQYSTPGPWLFGADIPGIGQMQVVQETLEQITVRIVPNADWSDRSAATLVERMVSLLGDVRIAIDLTDHIPKSASGKYRFAISKVSPYLDRNAQS